jgi:hypothetical protein
MLIKIHEFALNENKEAIECYENKSVGQVLNLNRLHRNALIGIL